jgi:hypothetical protein
MSMTWFKLHHEIIDDIKIRRFSAQEKWAWIVLLSLASKSSDRGKITADNEDLADYCEFNSTQDWLYYRDKLITKGMLEINATGGLTIIHWDDRQAKKPSDDPSRVKERVAKSRAKRKSETVSQSQEDVTRYKAIQAECNADVTTQTRSDQIRQEEIREDQIKQDPYTKEKSIACEVAPKKISTRISDTEAFEEKWQSPAKIDCYQLSKDLDFAAFVLKKLQNMPSAKKGDWVVEISTAINHIKKGRTDLEARGKIETYYEEYITNQKTEALSAKKPQDDRPRLRKPNPMTWTAEQKNWTYEQWEKYLNEQNQGNASIYATY